MTTITDKVTSCLETLNSIDEKEGKFDLSYFIRLWIFGYNRPQRYAWARADKRLAKGS